MGGRAASSRREGFFRSAKDEGLALLNALRSNLQAAWDGREFVKEMQRSGVLAVGAGRMGSLLLRVLGLPALINTFGGGPRQFANTRFDYSLGHPWDLKVHMAITGRAPLNDQTAMNEALDGGGGRRVPGPVRCRRLRLRRVPYVAAGVSRP